MLFRDRVPLIDLKPQRIALIKPSALGDIVHALPVLTALRQRYPAAHITWIVNHAYEPLLAGHPDLNATMPFDRHALRAGWLSGLAAHGRFLRQLRRQAFDLVIDLQGLLRTGLMSLATRAPRRVGLASAREGARWCYTDLVPDADLDPLHAVDRYWLIVDAMGGDPGPRRWFIPLPEDARQWATRTLDDLPRPWLMAAVGARWMTKRWPPVHFGVLARRAQERFGGSVVFVGGREDSPLAQSAIERLTGPHLDLTGRTTLPRLAAILARADVMIANDTGPLHLAVALGRPVLAPYTCTRAALTGPYGQARGAVEARVWCQGSCLKECSRLECMAELTPDRLWPILEDLLKQWPTNRQSA